jgi:hypothetical protein
MRCMGRTYSVKRQTILNYGRATFLNAHQRCGFEPGTCIIARSVARLKVFIFIYNKKHRYPLSIETSLLPVQFNTALDQEGVKLPFVHSYKSKVTTNPLGKHYITS